MKAVPLELRELPRWIVWRSETRKDKPTKVPYRADGFGRASSTDPTTWAEFETALIAVEAAIGDGIGFVLGDGIVGIDLDDVVGEDGEMRRDLLNGEIAEWIAALGGYVERSPSRRGLHVVGRGELPVWAGNGRRRGPIEVYGTGRYFTVTGDTFQGLGRFGELEHLEEFLAAAGISPPEPTVNAVPRTSEPLDLSDEELLERARNAENGAKFERLWAGDRSEYGSQSEADLALCGLLAFWSGPDPGRIDRLFRRSGLVRGKWDSRRGESTYGVQTIEKALAGRSDFYSPRLTRGSESVESVVDFLGGKGTTDSLTSPIREVSRVESVPPVAVDGTDFSESVESVHPFALPLEKFIAAKSETPPALIGDESENLLPAFGLMMLFAKGGKGKTTLAADAVLHFASGISWLGFEVPRPLRVVFIENEGPREPFRAKLELKKKLWGHELGGAVFVQTFDWGAFTLANDDYASRLRAFVEENKIDLVIGDPLDSLGVDGVGSPEDTRKFMALMSRAGLNQTVAFLLLHHPRKEDAKDELDEVSGAWGGKPDTMLRLEKLDGDRARLSFPKIRWSRRGTRRAYILAFDPDTESFSVAHEEEDEERDYITEVEKLLADRTWRTPKEIAAPKKAGGIGANVDTIRGLLEKNPARFVSRNGREVGRSAQATVWQLQDEDE